MFAKIIYYCVAAVVVGAVIVIAGVVTVTDGSVTAGVETTVAGA